MNFVLNHFSLLDSFDADLAATVLKKLKEGKSVQVKLDNTYSVILSVYIRINYY